MNKKNYIFLYFFNFLFFFCLKSYEVGSYSLPNCENRHSNEDRLLICECGDNSSLFCVFDGHAGDFVSNFLTQNFVEIFSAVEYLDDVEDLDINEKLKRTFITLDSKIVNQEGGSTAIVAYLINGRLFIANLGDSRAVLLKNNEIIQTIDHKILPNNEESKRILSKSGRISFEGIDLNQPRWNASWKRTIDTKIDLIEFNKYLENSLWRLISGSVIVEYGRESMYLRMSRSFGDLIFKEYGVSVEPDIQSFILNGTEFLIIASDGFWDAFSCEDAVQTVLELKGNYNIDNIAENLCLTARMLGSTDDITVIVVFFDESDSSSDESSELSDL